MQLARVSRLGLADSDEAVISRVRLTPRVERCSMAGRVGASVLRAAGPGLFRVLVARGPLDYAAVAARVAATRRGRRWLHRVRRLLGRGRAKSRLFDTPRSPNRACSRCPPPLSPPTRLPLSHLLPLPFCRWVWEAETLFRTLWEVRHERRPPNIAVL